MFRFKLVNIVIFLLYVNNIFGGISDKRLCADPNCSEPISIAKSLIRYSSPDREKLSFAPNQYMKVFSKSAGSNLDLWGVEINGKRGYIPKECIRESKVFTKDLKYLVSTESTTIESSIVPSIPEVLEKNEIKADSVKQPFEVVDGTTIFLPPEDTISPSSTKSNLQTTALPPLVPQDNIISINNENLKKDTVKEVIADNDITKKVIEKEVPATDDSLADKVLSTFSSWLSEDFGNQTSTDEEEEDEEEDEGDLSEEDEEYDEDEDVTDAFQQNKIKDDKQEGEKKLEQKVENIDLGINKQIHQKESNVASEIVNNNNFNKVDDVQGTEFIKQNFIQHHIMELTKKTDDKNERASKSIEVTTENLNMEVPKPLKEELGTVNQQTITSVESEKAQPSSESISIENDQEEIPVEEMRKADAILPGKTANVETNLNSFEYNTAKIQESSANTIKYDQAKDISENDIVVVTPGKETLNLDMIKDSIQSKDIADEKNQEYTEKTSIKNDPKILQVKEITKTEDTVKVSEHETSNMNIFQDSVQIDDVSIKNIQESSESTTEAIKMNTVRDSVQPKDVAKEKSQDYTETAFIKKDPVILQVQEITTTEDIVKVPENEVSNKIDDVPIKTMQQSSEMITNDQKTEITVKIPEKDALNIEDLDQSKHMDTDASLLDIDALNKEASLSINVQTNTEPAQAVANDQETNKINEITNNENIETIHHETEVDESNKSEGLLAGVLSLFSSAETENYSPGVLEQLETNTVEQNAVHDGSETKIIDSDTIPSSIDIANESNNVESEYSNNNKYEINEDIKTSADVSTTERKDEVQKGGVWNMLYKEPDDKFVESNADVLISTKADDINSCSMDSTSSGCQVEKHENFYGDFKSAAVADSIYLNFSEMYNLLGVLGITGATIIVFLWGYIYLDKRRREAPLIAKINSLEKDLFVTKKENQLLKASEEDQVDSVSSELVEELNVELEQVKDKYLMLEAEKQSLEKELENSTEVGLELNRMLTDILSSQNGSDTLIANVEQLQRQLVEQQGTINAINGTLNIKDTENHELKLELEICNKKVTQLQTELDKMVENLLKIEDEKENTQSSLENDITKLQEKLHKTASTMASDNQKLTEEINQFRVKYRETHRNLELKSNEYNLLKNNLTELKGAKNNKEMIKSILDVSAFKAEHEQLQRENKILTDQLKQEQEDKFNIQKQLENTNLEATGLKRKYEEADKHRLEAETKLEVLRNYFSEKEAQLQKKISKHESIWLEKQGEATSSTERIKFMQDELQNYKSQYESLKQEVVSQEVDLKSQISVLEKKAHENWVAARQAERKLEEAKQEAAQLRNRLTLRERNFNEEKGQNRMQSPMEQNGELPVSPIHITAESPPLLYTTRDHLTTSPPLTGLPPFLPPPPGVPFMPPPLAGVPPPFMPPPPSMFPGDHRPPPLGRMSSPPLNSQYSPNSRPYSPYDRDSPSSSYDDEYRLSPAHRAYSPYNNRENRRDYKGTTFRNNIRNYKNSNQSSGSGNSNESLEKINGRHHPKV